jgi:hypothetical protein
MTDFRRASSERNQNDLVRTATGRTGAAWTDMLPLAVWCRPAALLVLEERQRERMLEAYRLLAERGRNAANLTRSGHASIGAIGGASPPPSDQANPGSRSSAVPSRG